MSTVDVSLMSFSPFHIDAAVTSHHCIKWRLTGFYGHPEADQRHHGWTLLRRLHSMAHFPWLCVGDFNEILSAEEKCGRQERLDKGVSCVDRKALFPNTIVHHLDYWKSDHRPLLVEVLAATERRCMEQKKRCRFHFEACWADRQECRDLVANSWRVYGTAMEGVVSTIPWLR
ncbi:hypothetical protein Dsin_019594 [Dipteronia sinensis]|uniref:Endonuclease/exonuclease/phosphatase domain-containing protein n=1 Tax=Dipteronia sinensis TaxID=43782 RepID=A0AAE0A8X6_9ROSI|nr:hypothetical protein Dsin_019594 [Dipteronia sinensis]